jgi:S1-C subfamily serine protease
VGIAGRLWNRAVEVRPEHACIPGVRQSSQGSPRCSAAAAAGFVWDKQGHIVTNYHVIRGASDVLVSGGAAAPVRLDSPAAARGCTLRACLLNLIAL